MSLSLYIDSGNTRLKWLLYREGGVLCSGAELHDTLNVEVFLGAEQFTHVGAVVVASVKSSGLVASLIASAKLRFGQESVCEITHNMFSAEDLLIRSLSV